MAPAADPGPRAEGRVRWPLVREGRFWVWLKGVRELSPAQSTDIGVSEARRPMFKGKNIGKRTRFTARKKQRSPDAGRGLPQDRHRHATQLRRLGAGRPIHDSDEHQARAQCNQEIEILPHVVLLATFWRNCAGWAGRK